MYSIELQTIFYEYQNINHKINTSFVTSGLRTLMPNKLNLGSLEELGVLVIISTLPSPEKFKILLPIEQMYSKKVRLIKKDLQNCLDIFNFYSLSHIMKLTISVRFSLEIWLS